MATFDLSRATIRRPSPLRRLVGLLPLSLLRHIYFFRATGSWGNFHNPQTFGEKMQWRIIDDRRPMLRSAADRLANRETVAARARAANIEIALPELLAFADSADELIMKLRELERHSALPTRWLIKPNNSSGELLVIDGAPDWDEVRTIASRWRRPGVLETTHWLWANSQARRGLIAETWIGSPDEAPEEWKMFTIGGEPHFYVVARRNVTGSTRIHLSSDWVEMESWHHHPTARLEMRQPPPYRSEMDRAARVLARGWDFLRVDLYYADGKVWFGELTPYPSEGLLRATPGGAVFDDLVGRLWQLPQESGSSVARHE